MALSRDSIKKVHDYLNSLSSQSKDVRNNAEEGENVLMADSNFQSFAEGSNFGNEIKHAMKEIKSVLNSIVIVQTEALIAKTEDFLTEQTRLNNKSIR